MSESNQQQQAGVNKAQGQAGLPASGCSAHRDFLAFLLYTSDSGRCNEIPCRWGTLRDDMKEQWLNTADTKMAEWLADEESAKKRREAYDPRAFFC